MEGIVFDIEHNSMNDGPGIRTVVFLKGCPLRCVWCHNPESYLARPQLLFESRKCTACGRCAAVCDCHKVENGVHTVDWKRCISCGKCVERCLQDALTLCGKSMTEDEVLREVKKDRLFFESSGGGMTISGGEPLAQPFFTYALAKAAKKEGISVYIETSGFAPWQSVAPLLECVDGFLFDWKMTDPEKHQKLTGVEQRVIAENLAALDRAGAKIELRCPLIPAANATEEHLRGIAALANQYSHIESIRPEPYHSLGRSKAERMGAVQEKFTVPSKAQVEQWKSFLRQLTKTPVVDE